MLIEELIPPDQKAIIKAADTISAYLKCQMEVEAGNAEFSKAIEDIKSKLDVIELPEVAYFLELYASSYTLTLDELLDWLYSRLQIMVQVIAE